MAWFWIAVVVFVVALCAMHHSSRLAAQLKVFISARVVAKVSHSYALSPPLPSHAYTQTHTHFTCDVRVKADASLSTPPSHPGA
uniref:Putative secreted protein n=1 Tax=Anopheles darlingi TaxID=43151 RepID=A0A2M4DL15_ANODA